MATAKEQAEQRYQKEHGDVVASLNSIRSTMEGILLKKQKLSDPTLSKERKKLYESQIKKSEQYLASLFTSLEAEMWEETKAEIDWERTPEEPADGTSE